MVFGEDWIGGHNQRYTVSAKVDHMPKQHDNKAESAVPAIGVIHPYNLVRPYVTKQALEVRVFGVSGLIFVSFWSPLLQSLPQYINRTFVTSYKPTCTYLSQQSVCLDKCRGQDRLPTLLPHHLHTARWKVDLWLNCRATS